MPDRILQIDASFDPERNRWDSRLKSASAKYHQFYPLRMSEVGGTHIAIDRTGGQRVVFKSLLADHLTSAQLMRVEYEAGLVRRIHSEHYVCPIEVITSPESLHIVFPFARGIPLTKRLKANRLSVGECLQLARQVLSALCDLHRVHVLHRAVRPSNIIVNSNGEIDDAKLVDLGSTSSSHARLAQRDRLLANASYYSPEQSGAIDHDIIEASDLYSLGVVLFQALAGYLPFCGDDLHSVLFQQMTNSAPELRTSGLSIPRSVDEVIQRLLRKDPRERYQSAQAALADVVAIQDALASGIAEPKVVVGASDSRSTLVEPSFIARDAEIGVFDDMLENVRTGPSRLVVLEGESGSGKSRLLREASQRAAKKGVRVLGGIGRKDVAQHPFQILEGVVERFVAFARAEPEFAAHVSRALGQDADVVASSLPEIQEVLHAPQLEQTVSELMGEIRTIRALSKLLFSLGTAEAPALIILDDCQWADELTYKLLRYVQNQLVLVPSNVIFLVAFRSEEVGTSHPLRQIPPSAHLRLSLLNDVEVRQLAESMAGRLPTEALELIVQLGGGSPFMSSSVLHGLVECGALLYEDRRWRLDPLAMGAIQSADREIEFLTHRLELLSESTLNFITAGAVIGKEFDLHMASSLAGLSVEAAISAVDVARKRQLIWCRPDGVTCVFMHDQIRRALGDRLSRETLRKFHLSAAKHYRSSGGQCAPELAYHFDAAGASELAFPYALEAAEQARVRHALETAQQQYEIARRGIASQSPDLQFRVAEGLGDIHMLRGNYDAAGELFEEAARLATDAHTKAQIRGKLAELSLKRGDMERSVRDHEEALRGLDCWIPTSRLVLIAWLLWEVLVQVLHTFFPTVFVHRRKTPPSASQRLKFRLFSGLAHGCWYCRGCINTLWAHLRGLNLAEVYCPTAELGHAYSEHAPVMSLLGFFRRGVRYAQKSLLIRRELGDLWGQGQSLHYYGIVLYAASQYTECIQRCRESIRLLERMGDYWQVHIARYQIAASYLRLGDLSAAIEESRKNHESGLQLGDEQASGIILDVWARASLGKVPKEFLEAELSRKRFDAQGQAQVLFASAICHLHQRRYWQALQEMEQAARVTREAGVSNSYTLPINAWTITAYRLLIESANEYTPLRRQKLLASAKAAARAARMACWRCKNDLPHILREQAMLHSLLGQRRTARRCFSKSIALARQHQARLEVAQSVLSMAKVAAEFGWEISREDLHEAHAVYAELDVPFDPHEAADKGGGLIPSLSLADRFETLLESGRRIATGLSEEAIYHATLASASRLLRVPHGVVLKVDSAEAIDQWKAIAGILNWELNTSLIEASLASRRALGSVKASGGSPRDSVANGVAKSELCVPFYQRGRAVACLYVMHPDIRGLFGRDEERLADFLGTIAGAALENAEGFAELQELNATLEQRVADRTVVLESRSRELAVSNQQLERTAQELRQAQVELSASKLAAEAASEAKSRFLATMSHEIRTPMNGILGMADLVLGSPLNDRQRGHLETLKHSANALLTLLNDLLDFSKIEAGKMELEAIPFSLRDVVCDSVRLLAIQAGRKGLEMICRVDADVPSHVVGDPIRLRQVMVNLLGNAVKFTSQGEIRVEVSVLAESGREARLRFSIVDTGIGIPEDKRQWIFEAFHQTDSSVTRRFGGTGLGLAISSQFVELMDGAIRVESEEGVGTEFHVEIPFLVARQQSETQSQPALFVDRPCVLFSAQEASRRAMVELFEFLKIPLQDREALPRFSQEPIIAIVDLNLQSEELLGEITQKVFDGPIKPEDVICFVPPGSLDIIAECEALGIEHILTKPAKPAELQASLRNIVCRVAANGQDRDTETGQAAEERTPLYVLVADDSPVNREVATGLLEMFGHRSRAVANGAEAVAVLQEEAFDLVFMDIEMPVMDGFAATRAIRQLPGAESGIPIYAMTAHALAETDLQCREAGMDGFITKPIVPEEVQHILSQRAAWVS